MEEERDNMMPLIKMIAEKMEKKINRELKAYGITFSQIRVVALLYQSSKTDYSMKELEKIFQVSQQTIAGIIGRLENKGLIASYPDASDRRVKRIRLTKDGEAMGAQVANRLRQSEREMEQVLTAEEQETLTVLLQKIYHYVEQC